MDGACALTRLLEKTAPAPGFMHSGHEASRAVLKEARLLQEGQEMQRELLEGRQTLAHATLSDDVAYMVDANGVDEQIRRVESLRHNLASLEGQLPQLQRALEAHHVHHGANRTPDYRHREHLVDLCHNMTRFLAHGPQATAAALGYLQGSGGGGGGGDVHLSPRTPAVAAGMLTAQTDTLFEELNALLIALDRLENRADAALM